MPPIPNIVFFGAAGSGKSSIINMIAGQEVAAVSSSLQGCTFESACYPIDINGSTLNLWDTAGLNEVITGKVPDTKAIVSLFRLLRDLETGVNLLVFCMKGPRIQDVAPMNWRLFHEIICDRKVPIVIAITGLEEEVSMDGWWDYNRGSFERQEMFPQGVACITAIRGKEGVYELDQEYKESRQKMTDLLRRSHLKVAWSMQPIEWFSNILTVTYESRWWWPLFRWSPVEKKTVNRKEGPKVTEMAKRCGMTDEDAKALGEKLSKVL